MAAAPRGPDYQLLHRSAGPLHDILRQLAESVALGCSIGTVLILGVGGAETLLRGLRHARRLGEPRVKQQLWIGFAGWILLSLEFALAADIAETAIDPTWDELGRLAAIAAIRTLLNFFLERDVEKLSGRPAEAAHG